MKKLPFSEPFPYSRRKVVSGFGLGVGVSLVVLVALYLNKSLKTPAVLFQGFDSVGANSSFVERPLSSSSTAASYSYASNSSFGSSPNVTSESQNYVGLMQGNEDGKVPNKTREGNVSGINGKEGLKEAQKTHFVNFAESTVKNGSSSIQGANGTVVVRIGDTLASDGVFLEDTSSGNSSESLRNGSVIGRERNVIGNFSLFGKDVDTEKEKPTSNPSDWNSGVGDNNVGNFSHTGGLDQAPSREEMASQANLHGNSDRQDKVTISKYGSQASKTTGGSYESCDLFDGRWVRDDSKPYYPPGSCPYIDRDFDCHLNGRPDYGYEKWKWQPNGCNIPR